MKVHGIIISSLVFTLTFDNINCVDQNSGFLKHVIFISYQACVRGCEELQTCFSSLYSRRFKLCKLYNGSLPHDAHEFSEFSVQYNKQFHDVATCSNTTCWRNFSAVRVIDYCQDLQYILKALVLGNLRTVDSKIKYICYDDTHANDTTARNENQSDAYTQVQDHTAVSECLTSAKWSKVDLQCVCLRPLTGMDDELLHVNKWTFTLNGPTNYTAEAMCDEGFVHVANQSAICDATTNTWSGVEFTCCQNLTHGDWVKIYSLPSTRYTGSIKWSFSRGNAERSYCQYRNDTIMDSWSKRPPQKIRMDIMKHDQVEQFVVFNGTGTSMGDWFTVGTLLSSSWSSLSPTLDDLLITKNGRPRLPTVRFFIGSNTSFLDSDVPNGFLAVTKFYGLDSNFGYLPRTTIIYSKTKGMVNLTGKTTSDETGHADRFDIWVTF